MTDDILARIPENIAWLRNSDCDAEGVRFQVANQLEAAQAKIRELERRYADCDEAQTLAEQGHANARARIVELETECEIGWRRNRLMETRIAELEAEREPSEVRPETIDLMVALKESIDAEREPSEGHRCEHCSKPMIYLDSADEYVHTFAADAEACASKQEPSEAQSLEPGSQPEK